MSRILRCRWQGRIPLCPADHVRLGSILRYGRVADGSLFFLRVCPQCGRKVRCDKDLATLEPRPGDGRPGAEQLLLDLDRLARPEKPARVRRRVRRGAL